MDREMASIADSQDEDIDEDEAEAILPAELDDEFYSQLIQKANQISKYLQAAGQVELNAESNKMLVLCQRLRKENDAKAQDIEEKKFAMEDAEKRLVQAMTLSQVDNAKISKLKVETENAWKQADAAHEREQLAYEQVYILREKLSKLEAEVDKRSGKKEGGEELMSGLSSHKEGILKERDRLSAEVEELNRRLQIQRLYTDEIERKRAEVEAKNKELYKLVDDVSGEAYKEKRTIDVIKEKVAILTAENSALKEESKDLKAQADHLIANNVQQNMQILALKTNLERVNTQWTNASGKLAKYQSDLEHANEVKEKLQHELNHKNSLLKLKEDDFAKLKSELSKSEKSRETLVRKLQMSEQTRNALDEELSKIKTEATVQSKKENVSSKVAEMKEKKLQLLTRERNTLQSEIPKLQRKIYDAEEAVMLAHHEIRSLKEELKQRDILQQKHKAFISKIEVERDRNAEETQILEDKIESLDEDLRLKEEYILELKENVNELNTSLVKMQGLFESARTERNNFERNLQRCLEEKDELKNKLSVANRNVEQNLETIRAKESELLRQQKNLEKLEKECLKIRVEFRNLEVILQNTRAELKEKRLENDRLYKTLSDDEIRLDKLQKQLHLAIHEKDLIGTQMIRRNNEIALLKEKLETLQSAFYRGEKQYAERVEDIRLLKIEINNLRSQRNILSRGLANTADMRQEVLHVHRALNQERVKVKALEEEVVTPMNVHRWRKLAGKDPEKLELIMKIQCLQKRILSQTVTLTGREQALQNSCKLYNTLREFMLKLPSYKVKERLLETQHALVARDKKLKALSAELNAKNLDEKSKECVVDVLRSNLDATKKELIQEKKKKQKLLKECELIKQIHSYSAPSTCVRMAGAGFKMTLNT